MQSSPTQEPGQLQVATAAGPVPHALPKTTADSGDAGLINAKWMEGGRRQLDHNVPKKLQGLTVFVAPAPQYILP